MYEACWQLFNSLIYIIVDNHRALSIGGGGGGGGGGVSPDSLERKIERLTKMTNYHYIIKN